MLTPTGHWHRCDCLWRIHRKFRQTTANKVLMKSRGKICQCFLDGGYQRENNSKAPVSKWGGHCHLLKDIKIIITTEHTVDTASDRQRTVSTCSQLIRDKSKYYWFYDFLLPQSHILILYPLSSKLYSVLDSHFQCCTLYIIPPWFTCRIGCLKSRCSGVNFRVRFSCKLKSAQCWVSHANKLI